jgi:small subunit ribosomal protein S21
MAGKRSNGYRRGLENFSSTGNEEEEHYMIEVTLQEGDRLDWALKSFKKKVEKSGLLQELRRRRHYVKPSVMRQLKSAAAQRRARSRRNAR